VLGQEGQGSEQQQEQINHTTSGFTSNQISKLLSLIKPSNPGYEKLASKSVWIIDSRPSRHMTGNLQSLEHKASVAHIPVNLPNGAHVMESLQGSMNLSSQINLDKVLYVPKFSCNLISVA